jgi:hypothetical protein
MEFDKDEVYSSNLEHIAVPNFNGDVHEKYQEFYDGIRNYLDTLNLENIQLSEESINIGGGFFGGKNVKALGLRYKKGKLKKLSAFFLITNTGNVFNFSQYKQASLGFFDLLTGVDPSEKVDVIQSKLKTIEETEEFSVFNAIADMLYAEGIKQTNFES